jgi:hypothetical protein
MVTPVRSDGQAPIAQSAERLHGKEKVNGSIPFGGSRSEFIARPDQDSLGPGVSRFSARLPQCPSASVPAVNPRRRIGLLAGVTLMTATRTSMGSSDVLGDERDDALVARSLEDPDVSGSCFAGTPRRCTAMPPAASGATWPTTSWRRRSTRPSGAGTAMTRPGRGAALAVADHHQPDPPALPLRASHVPRAGARRCRSHPLCVVPPGGWVVVAVIVAVADLRMWTGTVSRDTPA